MQAENSTNAHFSIKPERMARCREILRLTQKVFAEALGVSRMTLNHYEHGYRHDDKRPVVIPRTAELALAATWVGVRSFQDLSKDSFERADAQLSQLAVDALAERQINTPYPIVVTLVSFARAWLGAVEWCDERSQRLPQAFPLLSEEAPGLVVLDFKSDAERLFFFVGHFGI